MPRASEDLARPSRSRSEFRVLRGEDIEGRSAQNQRAASFADAGEAAEHIKASKTEQYTVGCVRNQCRTWAALKVLEVYERHFPPPPPRE